MRKNDKNKRKMAVSSVVFSGALILGTGVAWSQGALDQPRSGHMGSGMSDSKSGQWSQENIRQLQQALKDKGHNPGPIDGRMGAQTQKAVRAFQQSQNLTVTGTLDSSTASALGVSMGRSGAGVDSDGKPAPGTPGGANRAPASSGSSSLGSGNTATDNRSGVGSDGKSSTGGGSGVTSDGKPLPGTPGGANRAPSSSESSPSSSGKTGTDNRTGVGSDGKSSTGGGTGTDSDGKPIPGTPGGAKRAPGTPGSGS